MLWYLLLVNFMFIGYFYKKNDNWYKISLLLLFVFIAFRRTDLGGTDAFFYRQFYENIPTLFHIWGYESVYGWGYTFLNSLCKTFSDSYLFYQVIYTFVNLYLMNLVIKKLEFKSYQKCLFLFVYFCYRGFYNSFVLLRQNLADLILWLLILIIIDLKERRWVKCGIGVVVTILFHSTSVFNIILFPLQYNLKRVDRKTKTIMTIGVSLFLYLWSGNISNFVLNVVIRFAGSRYLGYESRIGQDDINWVNYLVRLIIIVFIGIMYHSIHAKKKEQLFNSAIMATIIGSFRFALSTRFYEFYAIGLYGCLVIALDAFNKKSRLIYLFVLYSSMMIFLIRFLIVMDSGAYLDYSLFFAK